MSKKVDRREQILEAALRLSDRDGLEGLTMRALCEEVGVTAPVIYRHFADKEAIVDGLLARMLGGTGMEPPAAGEDAGRWLLDAFLRLRSEMLAHPQLLPLMSRTDATMRQALAVSELVLDAMEQLGLDPMARGGCFHALMAYTVGSVLMARSTDIRDSSVAEMIFSFPRVMQVGPALDARQESVFLRGLVALLRGFGVEIDA